MKNFYCLSLPLKAFYTFAVFALLLLFSNNTFAGGRTWTGATSTDWAIATNWSGNKLPASGDDITIPVTANMPVIQTSETVHSIIIKTGASLTQTAGSLYIVGASAQISGTLNQTGGNIYADHDFKLLTGGVFNQSGSSLVHMAKNAATNPSAKLSIATGATVNQSGGTIHVKDYSASPGTFNQTGATALFKIFHDWKPGGGSNFNSTNGTVQFTGTGGGGPDFASGKRQFSNIIVNAGVDPKFDNLNKSIIPVSGDFTNNNTTLNNGTNATFTFNGSSPQNIYSAVTGTSNATFGNLIINNNGSSVLLTSNANVAGNITLQSGTFDLSTYTSNRVSGGGTLSITGGTTMRLAGNTGGQTGSNFPLRETATIGTTGTVEYYGSGQTIYATPTYGNLTVSSLGTKTATAALNIAGNFTLSSATFVAGSYVHNIGGNWNMASGTFTNTGSTINFNGTSTQRIASTGAFNKIIINKASGSTTITTDVTANSTLTFTKGIITTGTNKIIIPSGGSIVGAGATTGWVSGNLQKYFPSTAGGTFEIGGAFYYSPLSATFSGAFTNGSLIASATGSAHPNICTSTITSKNISRYWSLSKPTVGAIAYTNSVLTFSWNAADNYTPMTPALLGVANYTVGAWSYPSVLGTPTTTSIVVKNVSTTGDFAVGETSVCTVASGFNYSAAYFCTNGGTAPITLNCGASAGTFTASPAGLSINAATGAINLAGSSTGTYVITNTVTGICISTSTKTISVNPGQAASILYPLGSYCQSAGTANVTLTGTTGGIYSSTYGLNIDDATGQVDLSNSTPGIYTVTYTVNSPYGCSPFITTTTITVTVANYANIAYLQDAYCLNGGIASVDFEGTTGGTFTSTTGLSINSATGNITLASSTPGTYMVTYSGAATGTCAAFTATTPITITSGSPGTISYAGSPFCPTGIATATISGLVGGVFSSTTGLEIDDITGDIDLYASTPGTYTVTYSFGGCYSTASVTISARATIAYAGSPYCSNGSTGAVTLTGATGGTYSSTTGLTLDPSTGTITLSTSTAGTYTVAYAVPAAGGCPAYNITTDVTITAAPSATISYNGSPFCNIIGTTASATLTGSIGGTFTSTAGLAIDAATGLINLGASTTGTYTVTYTIAASAPCAQYQTTTSITVSAIGTWTGDFSTTWNLAANWRCGIIPTSTTDVIIPSGVVNYPVLTSGITGTTKSVTLQAGTTITITSGTLQIAGTASTAGGRVNAINGKVEFNGGIAQSIPANFFTSNIVKDLIITNPTTVNLAGAVRVTNSVRFGNVNSSSLNSNGFLTLVSTSSNTANLLDITNGGVNSGNKINGDVTVERYTQSRRAYRFMTAPVNSTTSIRTNWMENTNNASNAVNNNPVPGYGTHITGTGGNTNAFDATTTNNPSLFTFNGASQAWSAAPNTAGLFTAGNGYRIIVRGSRNVDLNNNSATSSLTTLRATGTLVTGPVVFAATGGTAGTPALTKVVGAYNFIANPYASSVDWGSVIATSTDISPTLYIFDPTITGSYGRGGYVSYNGVLKVKNILSSMLTKDVQSGQAFFVQTIGNNPTLTFNENQKSTGFLPVFRSANDGPHVAISLLLPQQVGTTESADGTAAYFSDEYSNLIGHEDSYKFNNQDENLAIVRNGINLSLEGRKTVRGSDTVALKIWQLTGKSYVLKIDKENFASNVEGYLQDKFLNTSTALNDGENLVPFSVTSDPASSVTNRFNIVFETFSTLPVHLSGIKAYAKNKGVQIDWVAESESNIDIYEVERSADGKNFEIIGSVKAKNNPGIAQPYGLFDVKPSSGDNFYRIKTFEKSGDSKLSEVLRVQIAGEKNTISVASNPILGKTIRLLFDNVPKGNYGINIFSAAGEKVFSSKISYAGGTSFEQLNLTSYLPAGMYQLQVNGTTLMKSIQIIIQ